MVEVLPLVMTGVDWPGKSATQSASLTAILSGRFFSSELPYCCGPRQLSQPRAGGAENPKSQAPNPKKIPSTKVQRREMGRGAWKRREFAELDGRNGNAIGSTSNFEQ